MMNRKKIREAVEFASSIQTKRMVEGVEASSRAELSDAQKLCEIVLGIDSRTPREERPSFEDIYMDLARGLSQRSTCRRLAVGCVIVSPDFRRVLSIGYNGNAHRMPNDCDSDEPGRCGCIHAEANAAVKCPPDVPKHVYVTHLPCVACAKLLVNLGGVERVTFAEEYRIKDSLAIFMQADIPVFDSDANLRDGSEERFR